MNHWLMKSEPHECSIDDVRALKKTRLLPLAEMRARVELAKMWTLRPGNRLSVTPVTASEWEFICNRLR